MGELFVNIMLHTFVAEKHPQLLPALQAFPYLVVSSGTAEFKHTSLADFEALYETLGMGPKNYGWYQCKLHIAANNVYDQVGKDLLPKLWDALKKHPENLSDDDFVEMLKLEVHPAVANIYVDWEKE